MLLRFFSLGLLFGVSFAELRQFPKQQTVQNTDYRVSSVIRDILVNNSIIDEVLDDFEPSYFVDVVYPKFHEPVALGNDIPVKAVSDRPTFSFHSMIPPEKPEHNLTFTLILTDPDALSRTNPVKSEMCHWIITNLTTVVSHYPPVSSMGGELESYYPPSPPAKTGPHRYVFVLLKGDTANIEAPNERAHWGYGKIRHGVRDWADENGLKVVGANFFFAQNKKQ